MNRLLLGAILAGTVAGCGALPEFAVPAAGGAQQEDQPQVQAAAAADEDAFSYTTLSTEGEDGAQPAAPAPGGRFSKAFDKLDADKDGALSFDEFSSRLKNDKVKEKARALFDKLDANQDGKLARAELPAAKPRLSRDERLAKAFEELDTDKDGKVSLDEFKAQRPKRMPKPGPKPRRFFRFGGK